jgi:hypothetical protein
LDEMRRLALLLGALLVPALPLLTAAPAQAALGTICVGPVPADTTCNTTRTTIPLAIADATSGDLIRVGSGAYTDGPYVLPAGVSLRGSGAGTGTAATKLSLAAGAQTYVTVTGGTVADLRVDMTTGNGATGIAATNGTVDNVVVFGLGAINSNGLQAQGSQVHDATVNVTGGSGNTAIRSLGGNLLYSDSTWNGGAVGYRLVSGSDTVSRVTVNLAETAISVEGGTLNIDDAVIDLGTTGQSGLQAKPSSAADSATANVNHLTVVGGNGTSRGIAADANGAGTLTATISLTNSIVRGPTTSLVRSAGAGHTANFTVSRSDYLSTSPSAPTDGGGNLNVDPAFVNADGGDYHLRATSPVVDMGAGSAASLDRDSKGRSFDGDKNGTAVPDMGAFEVRDVTAPKTTFSAGPQGPTKDNSPVFQFKANDDGAKYECRVDAGAYVACGSPATTTPLPDGAHSFSVRATDPVFNVESPPATRSFTVDTVRPNATITRKPPKRFYKSRVKAKFSSDEAGFTFQCRLDNRAWQKCSSPYRFTVGRGKHVLLVRAVDAAGNVDATPARVKFKRLTRRR